MAEPLFGPASQLWSSMPGPSTGFMQGPPGSRPLGPLGMPFGGGIMAGPNPNPIQGDPYAMGGNMVNTGQFSAGLSAAIVPGPVGSFPAFSGAEIAVGVAAPALLAAVAMRRGQPLGPTNDQETEDFIYDALDLLPGATDVEVRCEGGRATITGTVPHKRLKRDVGEIAWAIPSLNDVQNNITITARRRSRGQGREPEPPSVGARKQT
jgi:BON domain